MTKLKNSNCDKAQKVIETKLKNSNWDATQKLKNSNCDKSQIMTNLKYSIWDKTQIFTKLKNSNCDNSNCYNTQIVTKPLLWQNSNCDKTQIVTKLKDSLWQNLKGQIVTKLRVWQNLIGKKKLNWWQNLIGKKKFFENSIDDKTSKKSFSENYLTLWQPMHRDDMFSGQLFSILRYFLLLGNESESCWCFYPEFKS